MPIILYSLIAILVTGLVSLGLLFRLRKDHLLVSPTFFQYWAIGFALFSFVHLPVFFINAGGHLSYSSYKLACAFMIFTALVSHLLFYRGVTPFLTKSKFWLNKFPFIVFSIVFGLFLILCFIFDIRIFIIMSIFTFGFILPMSLYLAVVFACLYIKGYSWHTCKKHPPVIILSLSWFLICILVIVWWFITREYNVDFWIFKLASLKIWYLARAAVHLLMLIGFLTYTRCWRHPNIADRVDKLS